MSSAFNVNLDKLTGKKKKRIITTIVIFFVDFFIHCIGPLAFYFNHINYFTYSIDIFYKKSERKKFLKTAIHTYIQKK